MAGSGAIIKREERVRIGPISVFALIAVLCLAVLSVLAFSTANAANTMSQRQATSVAGVYLNETAGQEFLAGVDEVLVTRGASGLEDSLKSIVEAAEAATDGQVQATATYETGVIHAEFVNGNGRVLSVDLTIRDNGTYRIDAWKVVAIQNEEQPGGGLLVLG